MKKKPANGLLTSKECLEALSLWNRKKTLGTDGLPAQFYSLLEWYFAFETRKLSITQRRGIIKLVPKKDAKSYFMIKNWRPLTLLNCDYKIATKAIANGLKIFLPNLTNDDQTGFIKDRFSGENIRLLGSVICYVKEKNLPGLFLFLDFEKAFGTIEWPFISKTCIELFWFRKQHNSLAQFLLQRSRKLCFK